MAEELKEQIKLECHYVIEPELTYTCFVDAARNKAFNREQLQKAFKYYAKMLSELRKTFDEEIRPLLNHWI